MSENQFQAWRSDPVRFITELLIDPETNKPFVLYPAQRRFIPLALKLTAEGRLMYPEAVFSCPKKSGKTATAALLMICVIVLYGGPFAEGLIFANDLEQSTARTFQAVCRILQASPAFRDAVKITATKVEFLSTGSTIQAIASDYASSAGSNPTYTCWDELWGYTSERSFRLWDENPPVPTRRISGRLVVSYAGYESESTLLEGLYKRGLKGEEIAPSLYAQRGLLMLWSHTVVAPWQTEDWLQQMREQLRPSAFLRMIENRFVSSESIFVDLGWWDACTDPALTPVLADPNLQVWVGVDASVKKDSTAIVGCTYDSGAKKVRLVYHRIFQPSPKDPLDFEATIENTLLDLRGRFSIREVRYDPYQMVSSAQRLKNAGLPMMEFPQSVPNLTEASQGLYDLIKGRNLVVYPDADLRLAISRAVAKETPRGWKIGKEKQTHKIDVVVALAQAALGAVQMQGWGGLFELWRQEAEAIKAKEAERAGPKMEQRATKKAESCPQCGSQNLTCYVGFSGCGQCGWTKPPDAPATTPEPEPSEAEELAAAQKNASGILWFLKF